MTWVGAQASATPRRRKGLSGVLLTAIVVAAFLAAVNGALFVAAPDLFRVDLAKGPYTAANNLELTRVYHRAIPLYERIIQDYPDSDYAILSRIGIANSNVGLGRIGDAIEQYEALLAEIADDGADSATYRYAVLTRLARIYRDMSDAAGHARVFAELEDQFPQSDAVREERVYLDTLAAQTSNEQLDLPDDFPFAIDRESVILPPVIGVGETIEVKIPIAPSDGPTGAFSIMTGLGFWQGFSVERITPTPTSVAEFWGRRQWQFRGIEEPVEIVAVLRAVAAGTYDFDVDLESNYDIIELGINRRISVEE